MTLRVRASALILACMALCTAGAPAAHAQDATHCIASWRKPMRLGYIDWGLSNSCDFPVAFEIDDCDMNPDMQAVCTVKTMSVAKHGETQGSNYHQPANARNFRDAGGGTTGSGGARNRRPDGPANATCPDQYYRSQTTGECVKCDAIWSEGRCIYD